VTFADAGRHPVRFEAVRPGSIVVDYIKLTKVAGGEAG
jgi:hypothetical protein